MHILKFYNFDSKFLFRPGIGTSPAIGTFTSFLILKNQNHENLKP